MLNNINTLRAISIVGILIAHVCLQLGNEVMGRFLGYLFVDVFFIISAFLLGLKYGNSPISFNFLSKRWYRLSVVYYPFLIISIIVLLTLGITIDVPSIALHLSYTNYLVNNHLYGTAFGHLWYLSMQMVCYIMIYILCNKALYTLIKKLFANAHIYISLIIGILITAWGGYILTLLGLPNRVFIILFLYFIVYIKAKDILQWSENYSNILCIIFFTLSNTFTLYCFIYHNLNEKLLLRDWIVLFTSLSWFLLFLKPLKHIKPFSIISFLSTISFEIYLVHHPFILGELSWLDSKNDNVFITIYKLIGTILTILVLSYFLHIIGKKCLISKSINKVSN